MARLRAERLAERSAARPTRSRRRARPRLVSRCVLGLLLSSHRLSLTLPASDASSPSVVSTVCSRRATTLSVWVPVLPSTSLPSSSVRPLACLPASPAVVADLPSFNRLQTSRPRSSSLPATPPVTTRSRASFLGTSSSPSGMTRSSTSSSATSSSRRAVSYLRSSPSSCLPSRLSRSLPKAKTSERALSRSLVPFGLGSALSPSLATLSLLPPP